MKTKQVNLLATRFPIEKAMNLVQNRDSKVRAPQLKVLCDSYGIATGCLSLFAHIPLVREETGQLYSVSKTLEALWQMKSLVTKQGETLDPVFLAHLVNFMGKANPGEIAGKGSMTDKTSGFVPKFLYAHKLYNDIPYEAWDKEDSRMALALGKGLEFILPARDIFTPEVIEKYIAPNVAKLRDAGLTNKEGVTKGASTYGMLTAAIDALVSSIVVEDDEEAENLVANLLKNRALVTNTFRILLQTYMANSVKRSPNMILDIHNWDNMPESIDVDSDEIHEVMRGSKTKPITDNLPF
jgi:hypothetical protein